MGALTELQAEGKIQQIGVSNMFAELLERALAAAPLVSLQNRYNVVHRVSDPASDRCAAEGVAFMPWQPLNGNHQGGASRRGRRARARAGPRSRWPGCLPALRRCW